VKKEAQVSNKFPFGVPMKWERAREGAGGGQCHNKARTVCKGCSPGPFVEKGHKSDAYFIFGTEIINS